MASEHGTGENVRENMDREVASAEKEVDGDAAARGVAVSLLKNLSSAAAISLNLKCAALAVSKEEELFSTGAESVQRV